MNFKITRPSRKSLKPNKLQAFIINSSDSEDELVTFHKNNDPNTLLDVAYDLVDKNEIGRAIHKFNQVIEHPQTLLDLKCKCHDMVAQLLIQTGQISRAIQSCEVGLELLKEKNPEEENSIENEKDDMKDSDKPITKNPMKALLYQTMARGQRNLGELSLALINFKKSKEFDEYNIELVEELDLEILEIENMIKNQKPVFGERYIMKGSNIDNIRADHSETMTKMKFPVEFTNDSPVLRSKISPEELESIMSGRIGLDQTGVTGRGSCVKRKLPEIADVD